MKRPQGPAFISARNLFGASWREYRHHLWRYLVLIGIVAVPSNLIALSSGLSVDVTVSFYVRLATLFMTAALLWAVDHRGDLTGLSVRRAYYEGSAILLRLVLVVAVLAIMLLPAAVGLSFYALGTVDNGSSIAVNVILGALAIVLALPSLYWLIRFSLAIFSVCDGAWPVAALKAARSLTLGRFWTVTKRLLLLVVFMLPLLVVPAIILILFTAVIHADIFVFFSTIFVFLMQLVVSLVIVPIGALYLHGLYRALEGA